MTVLFIENNEKTRLMYRVAEGLEERGHTVLWATSSRAWAEWLYEQGVAVDAVFDITESGERWINGELDARAREALTWMEKEGGVSVRNTILQDRVLSHKPYARGRAYIAVIADEARDFLETNDVELIIGEQTWAYELAIGHTGRALGMDTVIPLSVRIPDGRFGFFIGPDNETLIDVALPTEEDREQAAAFLSSFEQKKPKPRYFYINDKIDLPTLGWLKKPLEAGRDIYDETRYHWHDLKSYSSRDLAGVFQTITTMLGDPFTVEEPPEDPFVFSTLHVQPEASVDVFGAYMSNQLETIRAIARSVPSSHRILVKEHSNAIGDRGMSFYKAMADIPGVELVDPYADTFSFLEQADLTVSISGTSCYEAALLGRRAVTVAPMFFGDLLVASGWNPYASSLDEVQGWLEDEQAAASREQRITTLSEVIARSFVGNYSSPSFDASCMNDSNIHQLVEAFDTLLQHATNQRSDLTSSANAPS